ncbi:MAG: class E sortase [Cryobacterium sp.]|jgi:sortase A|nr:class E sortase [Cryobacterium sp.]
MTDEPATTRAAKLRTRKRDRRRVTVVGVVGELLITAGVLVFLFLGWQLWLNDLIVGDQQNQVAAGLSNSWTSGNVSLNHEQVITDYGDPVVMKAPAEAQAFAVMYVPRFGADYRRTISEGISTTRVLNKNGIGHYGTTQMPGAIGNFAVAAHRTTYGAPFSKIAELRVGDKIYVQTKDAFYTYVFRNRETVSPQGVGVLDPVPQFRDVDPTARLLTMTSCNPKFSAAERMIAYSVLESWQPVSAGPPAAIANLVSAKG